MSFRYWIFAVALGLTLVTSGQAQDEGEQPDSAPAEEQTQAQQFPLPIPVQIIESEEASEARERREEEARQREIDDLAAQQGMNMATQAMNDATQRMATYALVSTVIVGIGTALLVWTLLLTREANRAAQDAVEVTREIGIADTRAYITIDKVEVRFHETMAGEDRFVIQAKLKNKGKSPAEYFSVDLSIFLEDMNGKMVSSELAHNATKNDILHPQMGVAPTLGFGFKVGARDAIVSEQCSLCAVVSVSYTDIFRTTHELKEKRAVIGGFLEQGLMYNTMPSQGHKNGQK
jgi:hypothetical protein